MELVLVSFIWVWTLISHPIEKSQTAGIWKQNGEEEEEETTLNKEILKLVNLLSVQLH